MNLWNVLQLIYRFKPLRTAAQTAVAALVGTGTGLLNTDWVGVVSLAGMAFIITFLQALADGSSMLAEDRSSIEEPEITYEPKRAETDEVEGSD